MRHCDAAWRDMMMSYVENALACGRDLRGWSEADIERERQLRVEALEKLCLVDDYDGERLAALVLWEPFDSDKFWAGMGGAAGAGLPQPILEPGQEITVHDEIIDRRQEQSASTSKGAGGPILDIPGALEELEREPGGPQEWWPTKKSEPPPPPSRHPFIAWLSSWLGR